MVLPCRAPSCRSPSTRSVSFKNDVGEVRSVQHPIGRRMPPSRPLRRRLAQSRPLPGGRGGMQMLLPGGRSQAVGSVVSIQAGCSGSAAAGSAAADGGSTATAQPPEYPAPAVVAVAVVAVVSIAVPGRESAMKQLQSMLPPAPSAATPEKRHEQRQLAARDMRVAESSTR